MINKLISFHYFLSCYKLCSCINFLTGNYSEALSDSKIAIGLQSSPLTAFKKGNFSFQQSLLADRRSSDGANSEPISKLAGDNGVDLLAVLGLFQKSCYCRAELASTLARQ